MRSRSGIVSELTNTRGEPEAVLDLYGLVGKKVGVSYSW